MVDRERLFRELDSAREHGSIWVTSPPGAGKTSLAASYLRARRVAGFWYDVDPGDADPASFFNYLSLAAPKPRGKRPAALLTPSPEYFADLPNFTRRYFRAFFARLPRTAVVVFDNCHEVPPAAPFHEILRDALSEVRAGITLLMLSRNDPPTSLARAQANRLLRRMGADDLRLTADEMREIVLAERLVDEPTLKLLQERSGGWAAGLVLMLEHLKASGSLGTLRLGETFEEAFEYFAGQVLGSVDRPTGALPLILVAMVLIVKTNFDEVTAAAAAGAHPATTSFLRRLFSILLPAQMRSALFFAVFAGWGLWVRNRDSETHKRMMVLATLMPLPAGIDRIKWLPSTLPASTDSTCLYLLLWLTPVLIYDLVRRGRIHRAYVIGMGLNLPWIIAAHFVERSPWWLDTAPRLLGAHW